MSGYMTETLRIMVADDEMGMRMGVERVLKDFSLHLPRVGVDVNFVIEKVDTGEQVVEKIKTAPPNILLLDYKLPGMNGIEVLGKIGGHSDDLLVVMMTAYASLEMAVTATKHGAYDFLAKPFSPDELKSTVRKAAGNIILTRQARKLDEEKRQIRFQFISVLSHELKAPLAAIEGYLNILKERTAGDAPEVYDRMIERSLVRTEGMRKLIFDLLDLTRIESGQKRREMADVDIREIALAAIETLAPAAAERGISVNLRAEKPVRMLADRSEIEIVMNNLISNAVKYNKDNGRVDVQIEDNDDAVTLTVTDTGLGLSKEEAGRIFNDFVRIKNAKTRNISGSGLGLSTVKKLALLYGGDVKLVSEVDRGSTFTVTLKKEKKPAGEDE